MRNAKLLRFLVKHNTLARQVSNVETLEMVFSDFGSGNLHTNCTCGTDVHGLWLLAYELRICHILAHTRCHYSCLETKAGKLAVGFIGIIFVLYLVQAEVLAQFASLNLATTNLGLLAHGINALVLYTLTLSVSVWALRQPEAKQIASVQS